MTRPRLTFGIACMAAAALAACGGDDEGETSESAEPVTIDGVTTCLEDAGAKVEPIEVSLIDPPADLRVAFPPDDDVTVWVEETEEDAAQVIESSNELNELNEDSAGAAPPTQIGNAAYDPLAESVSEETVAAVEGCLG